MMMSLLLTIGVTAFSLASPERPLLLIPVEVNGKGPYRFVLDTGASMTVLSAELARELGVRGEKSAVGMGAGGKVPVSRGSVRELRGGETKHRDLDVAIM